LPPVSGPAGPCPRTKIKASRFRPVPMDFVRRRLAAGACYRRRPWRVPTCPKPPDPRSSVVWNWQHRNPCAEKSGPGLIPLPSASGCSGPGRL